MSLPEMCPLCNSGQQQQEVVTPHVYGGRKGQAFFHCQGCDVRYMHPGLTSEEEAHFYAAEFEGFMAGRSGAKGGWERAEDHIKANEANRLRRMKYIRPHLKAEGDILEVGCSSGFMLYPLSAAGHKCVGIEPSGIFREYVNHRGLVTYDSIGSLQKLDQERRFDAVLHFFVLEHISQPRAFLESQIALLKPGGKIVFEIPNVADPLYSVYDIPAFERFYWSVAHPWYFSKESLCFLLRQIGLPYEVFGDQRYDLSNHMTWARDGRPGGMGRFTEVLGVDVEENYKQALIRAGKCDTLIGVITKE